jgi:hypothetical protein
MDCTCMYANYMEQSHRDDLWSIVIFSKVLENIISINILGLIIF